MKFINRTVILIITFVLTYFAYVNYTISDNVRKMVFNLIHIIENKRGNYEMELTSFTDACYISELTYLLMKIFFVIITILLVSVKISNIKINIKQWWLPFFLILMSWVIILSVLFSYRWWSDYSFLGPIGGNLQYLFNGHGQHEFINYYNQGWLIKNIFSIFSFIFYLLNIKSGITKYSKLFIFILIIDFVIGNFIISSFD